MLSERMVQAEINVDADPTCPLVFCRGKVRAHQTLIGLLVELVLPATNAAQEIHAAHHAQFRGRVASANVDVQLITCSPGGVCVAARESS